MGNRIRSFPSRNNAGLTTCSLHTGPKTHAETSAVKRPLVMSDNYEIPPEQGYEAVVYARDLNANACWLEERLLALEGGEDCVVTSSGVSAFNGTFLVYNDYKGNEFFHISVGLENPDDMFADLDQAMEIVRGD